jgi:hypothetical protein
MSRAFNPLRVAATNPEMGTPKHSGFQEMAASLTANNPFGVKIYPTANKNEAEDPFARSL